MIKKLILVLICIISICSISNAKEIVEISKDSLGYNHYYVYIKFDDGTDYIEEFNNPFDCENFYYGMTHRPSGQDSNPLGLTKEEQDKFNAPIRNEAIDAWANRTTVINVKYDDKNDQDKDEYNDFKSPGSLLDLLF